jgi:hypothetical protein
VPSVSNIPSPTNEYSFLLDKWEEYFDPKFERPSFLNVNVF